MSLLQHCFTADTKFLTSFLTIAISIVTWCPPYIFFFLFNFGSTLSLLSSFNRELISKGIRRTSIESETFIFLKCHETKTSFSNSLNRTLCPKIWASYCSAEYSPKMQKTHFRLTHVWLKTSLLKITIKMLNNINM